MKLANASIINLLRYILRQFPFEITVIGVLDKRAIESSADYAEQHMQSAGTSVLSMSYGNMSLEKDPAKG